MARLYANENFPHPVVERLRTLGHDVLTMAEAGLAGQAVPDHAVLSLAHAQGRAVLTLNRRHFIALHRECADHSGIIVCTFDPDFSGQADRVNAAVAAESSLAGMLVRVNRPG